ncbi:MAG: Coenzyme F420 hydrogenase/dehydrogenase, beta subunit C-terminal domain [Methanomassiliicoccales archaeon]|nr:Coenzyme F420 hydrogenase/dehydrogenase, beta subunit C-terminal domain [Methanomassiliicoccales archaeon]
MSKELERHVWNLGKCLGCGACVSACSRGVLRFAQDAHPSHRVTERKVGLSAHRPDPCWGCEQLCVKVCPKMNSLPEGRMVSISSVRPSLTSKSSGHSMYGDQVVDVINHILVAALESEFIDGAIVTDVDAWIWDPQPRVVTSVKEIYETADRKVIWAPTLTALSEAVYEKGLKRIAIVGTPCTMQAARLLMESEAQGLEALRRSIRVLIGRFCGGIARKELVRELVERDMAISPTNIATMDRSTKDKSLVITLRDGNVREIPLASTQKYLRDGCARCTDYLAEAADLSIGDLGSRHGYATVVTWNDAGENLLTRSAQTGQLEITKRVDIEALQNAKRNKSRRARAEQLDEELLLMLEGLTESGSKAEAIKRLALTKQGGRA